MGILVGHPWQQHGRIMGRIARIIPVHSIIMATIIIIIINIVMGAGCTLAYWARFFENGRIDAYDHTYRRE